MNRILEYNISRDYEGIKLSSYLEMMAYPSSILKDLRKDASLCKINKKDYLNAMIASHTDGTRIHELLKGALTDKIDDREIFMKGIDYSYYYEQEDEE